MFNVTTNTVNLGMCLSLLETGPQNYYILRRVGISIFLHGYLEQYIADSYSLTVCLESEIWTQKWSSNDGGVFMKLNIFVFHVKVPT